ncbi:type VI secretion system PAAR protein [Aliivibrio sifiae]|uniref:type VI secretion system PAAR protein n=1 Tax=Aliivibrio sifiae TaxID=566293 RepID=UPI0026D3F9ED|nr:type VI secretion system PAAR protein [Aliivibrio sifiae]
MGNAVKVGDKGTDHDGFPQTPIITGSPNVNIDGAPACREGDSLMPHAKPKHPPHPRTISSGSSSVFINGKPAALTGSSISCGGVTIGGGTVNIGDKAPVNTGTSSLPSNPPEAESPFITNKRAAYQKRLAERSAALENSHASKAYDSPLITRGSKATQALDDSWRNEQQCSLIDELNNNHQDIVILDMEDTHKLLNNFWVDLGKDTAFLAASINSANTWFQHTTPIFDAKGLVKQFGDINIKADIIESKGKQFIAFSGKKNGKEILHALVNGTRINMNGKKYPINSPKVQQVGLSPKARANGFKGAGVLTFVVSAAIATTDLVFKDDYHLVDWFGNVGSDMFKALLQFGAGEAVLFGIVALTGYIVLGFVLVAVAYLTIEWLWNEYKVTDEIILELERVIN